MKHLQPPPSETAFALSARNISSSALKLAFFFILCVAWAITATATFAQQYGNALPAAMPNASGNTENNVSTVYNIPTTLEQFNDPLWHERDVRWFDIARFEHGSNGSEWTISSHGVNIRQLASRSEENRYQEEISRPDSPYTYINVYDAQGRLALKAVDFYGRSIGEYVSYGSTGQIIHRREANNGLFTYPVADLITHMRTCCQLNLLDTRRMLLFRTIGDVPPFYYAIYVWSSPDGKVNRSNRLEGYLVDAENGTLVYHMTSGILITPDNIQGNLYEEYKRLHAQKTRLSIARNQQALEKAAVLIKMFADTPDKRNTVFDLQSAANELEYNFSLYDIRTDPTAFSEQRRAWLILALQIIDLTDRYNPPSLSDENNPANLCWLKVLPPPIDGIYYPMPIDPAEIKDPVARAQYEQDIANNERNCVRAEREVIFKRLTGEDPDLDSKASFLASIQNFITANYRPAAIMNDCKELHALIDQYLSSPERRQALLDALAIPALPGSPN